VHSVWPSVSRWYPEVKYSLISSALAKDLKNLDTNSVSQSDVTWLGTLCFEKMCLINNSASIVASSDLMVRMNSACLVSRFTTTKMSV